MALIISLPLIKAIQFYLILQAACSISSLAVNFENNEGVINQVVDDPAHVHGPLDPLHAALYGETYFQSFIKKYGKFYPSYKEYSHRLKIFKRNLVRALHHQALDPTATHGITPFSDLSEEEFATHFLRLHDPSAPISNGAPAPILPADDLPSDFDWREHGAVTEVKAQVS